MTIHNIFPNNDETFKHNIVKSSFTVPNVENIIYQNPIHYMGGFHNNPIVYPLYNLSTVFKNHEQEKIKNIYLKIASEYWDVNFVPIDQDLREGYSEGEYGAYVKVEYNESSLNNHVFVPRSQVDEIMNEQTSFE